MPKKTAGLEDTSRWCEWCQEFRNSARGFDKHLKSCQAKHEAEMALSMHHTKRQRTEYISQQGSSEVSMNQLD